MPHRPIREVLKAHASDLMRVPGVVGTGQTERQGQPAVMVLVIRFSPELLARIPKTLEGYRVVVLETGTVRRLQRGAE